MIEELQKGIETAYIDGSIVSNSLYKPQFVANDYYYNGWNHTASSDTKRAGD